MAIPTHCARCRRKFVKDEAAEKQALAWYREEYGEEPDEDHPALCKRCYEILMEFDRLRRLQSRSHLN